MKFYKKYKKSSVILLLVLQYLFQFLIVPLCFPANYYSYDYSNDAGALSIIVIFFSFAIIGMIFVSKNILHWIYADIIYCILIYIYDGNGAYGIGIKKSIHLDTMIEGYGTYNRSDRWFDIIIWMCVLFIIQLIALIITIIAKKIHSYLKTKRSK